MTPMLTMPLRELSMSPGVAEELSRVFLDNLVDCYARLSTVDDEKAEDFAQRGRVHLHGGAERIHWKELTLLDVPNLLATLDRMELKYNEVRGIEAIGADG